MNNSFIFADVETSGLDASRHGILQFAWIVEKDGELIEESRWDVQLFPDQDVCTQALEVNGFTLERIKHGMDPSILARLLKRSFFSVGPSPIVGHNVMFDFGFLIELNKRTNSNFMSSVDFHQVIDTLALARWFQIAGIIDPPNCKLKSLCEFFGIPIKPHDALEDIRATRKLFHILLNMLGEVKPYVKKTL
jgi:DNA polymerase III epsilon subunit-like protein